MKNIILAAMACISVAGCAQSTWVKPGGTQSQFNQDQAACKYDADKAAAPSMASSGLLSGLQSATLAKECMEAHGYTLERASANHTSAQFAVIRAPGQTLDQLKTLEKTCTSQGASQTDAIACLNRNHATVIPESAFSDYVKKAVASGAIKEGDLRKGVPVAEEDKLAVDRLIWKDFGIH
jgi:hypothetical protein